MRKRLYTIMAVCLLIIMFSPFSNSVKVNAEGRYGDVNASEKIDAADALLVLKHAAKISLLEDGQLIYADVSGDTNADAVDALLILKYAAKIIDEFPVESILPTGTPEGVSPTVEPTAEPTATPTTEPTATPTAEPTPTPTAEPTVQPNAITYDEQLNSYTMHGQCVDEEGNSVNASYRLENPFANADITEDMTKGADGYPDWKKGVTIKYEVFIPEEAKDAVVLSFEKTERKVNKDDILKKRTCDRYSESDPSYSMGTAEIYVEILEDGSTKEYTVLSGYGENVRYNPEYPAEGLYKISDNGSIDVYKKGANPDLEESWVSISNIGSGYYEAYKATYSEGNVNSQMRETDSNSFLTIYASGSTMYCEEDLGAVELNPNHPNYGQEVRYYYDNLFMLTANGAPGVTASKVAGAKNSPTMENYGEWHSVIVTIKNDFIQFYVDQTKLSLSNYYNFHGYDPIGEVTWMSRKLFNKGYGAAYGPKFSPSAPNALGETIMEFLSDPETALNIGGHGFMSNMTQIATVGTPEGVMVRNLQFFDFVWEDKDIINDGAKDVAVKKLNNAVVDENGIYSFTNPVAEGTYTYSNNGADTSIDAYYGIEFENPFVNNNVITQSFADILPEEKLVFKNTIAGGADTVAMADGNYFSDYYYGDLNKAVKDLTAAEKHPVFATVKTAFYRPAWTKGATVSFWFKPTEEMLNTLDPIYTMFNEGTFVFMLTADGSLSYQDLSAKEWGGNPKAVMSSRNGQSANQFTVLGNASLVKAGEWNHYTITFANDWIQVYINGQELIYPTVGFTRTYTKDFNGGFMTRYNNIGKIKGDPDSVRLYMTKSGGISTADLDNDSTCIRANGVYKNGYNAETETSQGIQYRLLMDALSSEGSVFYIGGCPTPMNNTTVNGARHTGNAVKSGFSTEHSLKEGNEFTGLSFYNYELSAEEVEAIYNVLERP